MTKYISCNQTRQISYFNAKRDSSHRALHPVSTVPHGGQMEGLQGKRRGLELRVQCCFTSTETVWTVRDGEPRTATSTLIQLLSFGLELSPDLELSPELSKYEQR